MSTMNKITLNSEKDLTKLILSIRDIIQPLHLDIPKSTLSRLIRKEVMLFSLSYPSEITEEEIVVYAGKVEANIQDGLKVKESKTKKKGIKLLNKNDAKRNKLITMLAAIVLYVLAVVMLIATIFTDDASFLVGLVITFAGGAIATSYCIENSKKLDTIEENPPADALPVAFTISLISLFVIGFLVLCYYVILPEVSLRSYEFIFYLCLVLIGLLGISNYILLHFYGKRLNAKRKKRKITLLRLTVFTTLGSFALGLGYTGIGSLTATSAFRAKDLANLLPIEEVTGESAVSKDFSYENSDILLPTLDLTLSYRQAEIALGDYGNQYFINQNHFSIQCINENGVNRLVRVTPLEYSNMFVSLQRNKTGTPGYILVDTVTGEVELKLGKRIVYCESAKLDTDIIRHFRTNNIGEFYDNYFFEIDDDFNPYWVFPCYTYRVGLSGGKFPNKVITIDANTGRIDRYALKDAPAWIDNVVDRSVVKSLVNYTLQYKNGFINATIGSKEGVFVLNDEYNYFAKDGIPYFVSSVTSKDNRDRTSVGFITVNLQTMKTKYYKQVGITEDRARTIAVSDADVKAMNLSSTWPVFITINNVPTFFLTLKNNVKVQKYVFIDQKSGENLVIEDSFQDAYSSYSSLLQDDVEPTAISGTIDRVNIIDEELYLSLVGSERIYEIKLRDDPRLVLLSQGDSISFTSYLVEDQHGYYPVIAITDIELKTTN